MRGMRNFSDRVDGYRRFMTMALTLVTTGVGASWTTAALAAPAPFVCYYNPTSPCYTATGYGGSIQDINPVEFVVGPGGSGSIAYANNDHGGTVYAHTQGTFIDEYQSVQSYRATADLKHYISVDLAVGIADAVVPLRIIGSAFQTNINGSGYVSYSASQQGQFVLGRQSFAGAFLPETLFFMNDIVYVKPNVPIEVRMMAQAAGNISVTVDPVYEIVGEYASRYKLTGLLSSDPIAAVPEPATWSMMIAGFGAIGVAMRRRRVATRASSAA